LTIWRQLHDQLTDYAVVVELPNDLPAVRVDAPLVTQVFANLLENCVRHTPPGTRITVSASNEGTMVRVVVEDNGPGLPPGDPERLFKKFQRGRDEGNSGGAGLGLAICRAIVQAHGGIITAMPRPGGGTRFAFTLPIAAAET
jgi:two-component system sensor histidine kinase KdpD